VRFNFAGHSSRPGPDAEFEAGERVRHWGYPDRDVGQFCAFLGRRRLTAVSHDARRSKTVKWSVCVAFGAWDFSILLDLQLL
jgi:hypothetical protein